MVLRVPRVGGNVKSYMLAYDFRTTAYTRDPLDHFSLLKGIEDPVENLEKNCENLSSKFQLAPFPRDYDSQ